MRTKAKRTLARIVLLLDWLTRWAFWDRIVAWARKTTRYECLVCGGSGFLVSELGPYVNTVRDCPKCQRGAYALES